jgi:hypothetical protein
MLVTETLFQPYKVQRTIAEVDKHLLAYVNNGKCEEALEEVKGNRLLFALDTTIENKALSFVP